MGTKISIKQLRPLRGMAILKREDKRKKTSGGIVIPDTAKTRNTKAEIIAIGKLPIEKGKEIDYDLNVGDKVWASINHGWMQYVGPNKEEYYWVRQKDVQLDINQFNGEIE